MAIELLRHELRHIQGHLRHLIKFAIPDLDQISDFTPHQLYHKDTVVCVRTGDEYRLYKCLKHNVTGDMDADSWALHMVYVAIGTRLGRYTDKVQYKFITTEDNTRRVKIEKFNFDSTKNPLDVFIGGTLVDAEDYTIEGSYVVLKDHVRGFAKGREIILNVYGE